MTSVNAEGEAPRKDSWSTQEADMRYRVTLVLARSREFPLGNSCCFTVLLLPLEKDLSLDLDAWSRQRYGNPVCRFCRDIGEAWGELKHDREGWFLAFGHGEASEEAFFLEPQVSFALGARIPIVEWDGQIREFRAVDLAPQQAEKDPMALAPNSALGTDPLATVLHELCERLTERDGDPAATCRLLEREAEVKSGELAAILDNIPEETRSADKILQRLHRLPP